MQIFFFFNDTATTEIYTLSLHDALPISCSACWAGPSLHGLRTSIAAPRSSRSEEHTSELQSLRHLVCRLLLEKKKKHTNISPNADYEKKPFKLAHPYFKLPITISP